MSDHQVVGKIGRVTGTIRPGKLGEVMIPVRGGSEAFLARSDGGNDIPAGARVVVVEYHPPRTVIIEAVP
jgi:hypothetical protein